MKTDEAISAETAADFLLIATAIASTIVLHFCLEPAKRHTIFDLPGGTAKVLGESECKLPFASSFLRQLKEKNFDFSA